MFDSDGFAKMNRSEVIKFLSDIVKYEGLKKAFDVAFTVTDKREESVEELLVDVLQNFINNANETGSLF